MKKYIAIATLLAAGSAFANAAVGISLESASYKSDTDITKIEGITGSYSFTLVLNATAMKEILGKNGESVVRPMLALADNNFDMGLATALNNTGFVGTFNYNSSTMSNLTMGGVASENRQPMTESGSTPATNAFANGDGNSLNSSLSTLSGLAVTFSHTDTVSSSLYVTLKFSDNTTKELYGTRASFKWRDGVGKLNNFYINEGYVDSVYLFNSALSKDDALTINASAIPEPSTFGLLAGLGALALVGTRRRRR